MERSRGTVFIAVFMLVLLVVASCSVVHSTVADDAQLQYDRGEALAKQGNWAGSIVEWRKAVNDFSEEGQSGPWVRAVKANALAGIAESQRQSGQLDAALSTCAALRANYPQFRSQCAEAAVISGKCCQAKGQKDKAVEFYTNVLRSYPDKLNRSLLARGRISELLDAGAVISDQARTELTDAITTYDNAKREDDTISTARRAAKAKADAGDLSGAKADLAALVADQRVQLSSNRLKLFGEMQLRLRDKARAKLVFEKLLTLSSGESMPEEYRRLRLEVLYNQGDFSAVVAEGNAALAIYADGIQGCELLYYTARAYDRMDDIPKCLELYGALIIRYGSSNDDDIRPIVPIALVRSGLRLAETGRKDLAAAAFRRVITDFPESKLAGSADVSLRRLTTGGNK